LIVGLLARYMEFGGKGRLQEIDRTNGLVLPLNSFMDVGRFFLFN